MSSYWGEVESDDDDEHVNAAETLLLSIQGKFRNGFSNFDLPSLYQPSATHRGAKKEYVVFLN